MNMILSGSYQQIKNMEKYKCIQYLYSNLLIPAQFKIKKDGTGLITSIEFVIDQSTQSKVDNNNNNQKKKKKKNPL